MNPLGGIIKQLRPAHSPIVIPNGRTNRTNESPQRLERVDHLSASRKIDISCLLQDYSGQRVFWINEHDERSISPNAKGERSLALQQLTNCQASGWPAIRFTAGLALLWDILDVEEAKQQPG